MYPKSPMEPMYICNLYIRLTKQQYKQNNKKSVTNKKKIHMMEVLKMIAKHGISIKVARKCLYESHFPYEYQKGLSSFYGTFS